MTCPFCKCDPYEYVDNGICMERVAISCCQLGIGLWRGDKKAKQAFRFMRSNSPRKKARAKKIIEEMED